MGEEKGENSMTREEQEQRFRTFVQGDMLAQHLPSIHSGHPIIVRAPGQNEPWQLTSKIGGRLAN